MNDLDILKDNEGVSIGSANIYVNKFKRNEEVGKITSVQRIFNELSQVKKDLPEVWDEDTEKEILSYYYVKFGDRTGEDFAKVSPKIATAINRAYMKEFSAELVLNKLKNLVDVSDLKTYSSNQLKLPAPKEIFNVCIPDGKYSYVKKLPRITKEQLELIQFLEKDKICFSSDEEGVFVTVKPGNEASFDDLFNFSDKENMIYMMFKEQLNDEFKAKKLVLLSRMLNESEKKPIKKSKKEKAIDVTNE